MQYPSIGKQKTRPDFNLQLHEGFGNQGVMVKAVGLIGRQIRRNRI